MLLRDVRLRHSRCTGRSTEVATIDSSVISLRLQQLTVHCIDAVDADRCVVQPASILYAKFAVAYCVGLRVQQLICLSRSQQYYTVTYIKVSKNVIKVSAVMLTWFFSQNQIPYLWEFFWSNGRRRRVWFIPFVDRPKHVSFQVKLWAPLTTGAVPEPLCSCYYAALGLYQVSA